MKPVPTARPLAAWASLLLLLPALLLPGLALAQPASGPQPTPAVLRLDDLLEALRTANPALEAARLDAAALATRPRQVSALPDPSVSAGYRPFAVGGIDGVVPGQLMVEQMIPYPGKRRLAGEAAAYGAEMAAHDADELALAMAYEVKESYYELFRIQEQDRLLQSFAEQLADFESAAAAKYEVGVGPQQAILKAQLEKNTLARRRLDLSAMRRMHLERLARLTNRPALAAQAGALVLERPPLALDAPGIAAPVAEAALASRPELQAIEAGIAMAGTEIAMAKREYLPDFMVGAGFMDMMTMNGAVAPLDNLGDRFGISFGISVPLQRGRRDAALEAAHLRRQALEARYASARLEIETEAHDLQHRLAEDERALRLYRDTLLPQAETTLEATLSAYTTGRTDFLDLLDAERMRYELRMDYEETFADYARTHARLERVLGVTRLAEAPATGARSTGAR